MSDECKKELTPRHPASQPDSKDPIITIDEETVKGMLRPSPYPTTWKSPKKSIELTDPDQPGRVSQSFLDMLNGESAKMTAALQNPDNWEGIQMAAKEAPSKIREMEQDLGMSASIGRSGAVGKEFVERALGEKLPERIEPEDTKHYPFELSPTERNKLDVILHAAHKQWPADPVRLPWRRRLLDRLKCLLGFHDPCKGSRGHRFCHRKQCKKYLGLW